MTAFCLEPLTVLDLDALDTIAVAGANGCHAVSFWAHSPWPGMTVPCLVADAATARAVRRRLEAEGLAACNLEVFELRPDVDIAGFARPFEHGATIGCTGVAVIFGEDPEPTRRIDQFAALCGLAGQFALRVNAEFISYRDPRTLAQTAALLDAAGQPNARITIDLLHLTRSGGTPVQVRAIDPARIGHAQICDGPADMPPDRRRHEAAADRLVPGEGSFAIRAFHEALPDLPLGLEVPWNAPALAGLDPRERVARIVAGARRCLG
jgi:sugar phosphate isomerase/epimerase